jgi:membrane protein
VKDRFTRVLAGVDRFQQRHRVLGLPIAVFKRFGEHNGGRLSATISYYGFFSLFPLLLVFVTVLGIVLEDNEELREDLIDGAVGQIPVIGSQLRTDSLPGDGWVLAVGIVGALWAGLGAVGALQHAFDTIADVPVRARCNVFIRKLKSVAFLALLGAGLTLSTILSNLASLFGGGYLTGVLGIVATFVVNALLLAMTLTVLPAERQPVRHQLPGIVVGAVGLVVLQQLGSLVVRHFIAGASDTYGTFAIVIALLSWFFLVSRVVLMSAELNRVLAADLWPRRLVASGDPTAADRRAMTLDVQRIQRDERLGYEVSVDGRVATKDPVTTDDQPATSR